MAHHQPPNPLCRNPALTIYNPTSILTDFGPRCTGASLCCCCVLRLMPWDLLHVDHAACSEGLVSDRLHPLG